MFSHSCFTGVVKWSFWISPLLLCVPSVQASRVAPTTELVKASQGETIGFVVAGSASNHRTEWYRNGVYLGSHDGSAAGASSAAHSYWHAMEFPTTDTYTIEAVIYDATYTPIGAPVLWTVEVEPRPRILYVHNAVELFDNTNRRDHLFNFVAEASFNALILYGVDNYLRSIAPGGLDCTPMRSNSNDFETFGRLASLIREARTWGVEHVYVAMGASSATLQANLDALETYGCKQALDPTGVIDGVITEYEFWNGASFGTYQALIDGLNGIKSRQGIQEVATYLPGRPLDAAQHDIRWITQRVDRVLIAAYLNQPEISSPVQEALRSMSDLSAAPQVWWAFSAEEEYDRHLRCSAGHTTNFMGDWLGQRQQESNDALDAAEDLVLSQYEAMEESWRNGVRLRGFAYFHDGFLMDYLNNGPSTHRDRPPTPCWSDTTACESRSRDCSIQLSVGDLYTFSIKAWDEDGDLSGSDWYGWEAAGVQYHPSSSNNNPGLQYVSEINGGTGSEARFEHTLEFVASGSYEIVVFAFDVRTAGSYSEAMTWLVTVVD